jgi:hypothetical protein
MDKKEMLSLKEIVNPTNVKKMTEAEIEIEMKKLWKCTRCHKIIEIEEDMCWDCDTKKPEKIEYPSREETIKYLKKTGSSVPFWLGVSFLVIAGYVLFKGHLRRGIETFDLIFTGLFLVPAVILIIYSAFRKIRGM